MTSLCNETILIDSRLPDLDRLLAGIRSDILVRMVAPDDDGVAALREAMDSDARAVHVVAHGRAPAMWLSAAGSTYTHREARRARRTPTFSSIAAAPRREMPAAHWWKGLRP